MMEYLLFNNGRWIQHMEPGSCVNAPGIKKVAVNEELTSWELETTSLNFTKDVSMMHQVFTFAKIATLPREDTVIYRQI